MTPAALLLGRQWVSSSLDGETHTYTHTYTQTHTHTHTRTSERDFFVRNFSLYFSFISASEKYRADPSRLLQAGGTLMAERTGEVETWTRAFSSLISRKQTGGGGMDAIHLSSLPFLPVLLSRHKLLPSVPSPLLLLFSRSLSRAGLHEATPTHLHTHTQSLKGKGSQ